MDAGGVFCFTAHGLPRVFASQRRSGPRYAVITVAHPESLQSHGYAALPSGLVRARHTALWRSSIACDSIDVASSIEVPAAAASCCQDQRPGCPPAPSSNACSNYVSSQRVQE
jgi:hypothetical protein